MQLINGRLALPFLQLALFLAPTAAPAAPPAAPFLVQVQSKTENIASSFWKAFVSTFGGKPMRVADLIVSVLDQEGRPLPGATVLVGQKQGDPFVGNKLPTDSTGIAAFSNEYLHSGSPVSITTSMRGYTTVSLLKTRANTVQISMQKIPDARGVGFLQGKLNGIPQLDNGSLEMGFFIPASRPETLLNFDIQNFISSYKVKVDIYGQRDIPGNVVLPNQTKFWGLIPVNVSKPYFVMPLPSGAQSHMYGLAGGIPINSAISAIQNKDFLELLNLASFTNVGWTRDRVEVGGNETFDIHLSHPIAPNQINSLITNVQEKLDAVSISLVDPVGDKGDFVAMDIKTLKSENMKNRGGTIRLGQVRSRRKEGFYVFTALFDRTQISNKKSRSVVGSFQPVGGRSNVSFSRFLNPIRALGVGQGNREFRFSSAAAGNLNPDLLIVNIISEKNNPETMGVTKTVLWSAIFNGSTEKIELPDLDRPVLPDPDSAKGEKFYWEVTSLHSANNQREFLDLQESIRNLQDVSSLRQAF